MLYRPLVLFVLAVLLGPLVNGQRLALADANWPQWRGPQGDGHAADTNLPVKWDASNVVWKADLTGSGQSSPVIWGGKIFLTSATENGHQRMVMCLNRKTGETLWEKAAWTGEPEVSHKMNNWASATCATDGERVVAFFGRGGLHCYDLDGKHLWSRDLGRFEGPWGTAASPIIVGDIVVQNCDADDTAYLLGVDKRSGETVWKTPRPTFRGWSTPILVETEKRSELVLNGHTGVTAYDPATGEELWFCKGDNGRGSPTVTPYKDLLIAVSGRPGAMFAMRAGGSGNVNETHEQWRTIRKGTRDLPSPIVVDDYLFVAALRPGLASCYDAASGKELHKMRLGVGSSASPVAAGGLVYQPDESGAVYVVKLGQSMEVVAVNQVDSGDGEVFRSSLTPCEGQWFLRSDKTLYCIGK